MRVWVGGGEGMCKGRGRGKQCGRKLVAGWVGARGGAGGEVEVRLEGRCGSVESE